MGGTLRQGAAAPEPARNFDTEEQSYISIYDVHRESSKVICLYINVHRKNTGHKNLYIPQNNILAV